ncbi:conserved hypothetical protein [Vibrio crassostreae]|uniref:hypothetical protein n=1 Tax=Vibrio crassostreae TaxID=246167 RepID=UPI001B300F72|nr:hypothetical protein [Vibrio crassostreae]CAK1819310.1 conserved hypothetical protein [Vibrio crassostreae]CAK1819644.1 conserved hypothetical protein [Vibrio crassostreae]CAK1878455.1 conserved hypothetical protein [Vibrio crassostreae]CAK1881292.1 conserved hypothetical protein [Vibrio crassostreae]CAK1895535.1 conserved hypothetical protein [Vibrio crassostreae]
MILGYVKCTAPNCGEAMEVSQCSGKRAAYLKGRCHVCQCTEQRSNANTQDYLKQHMPLEALNAVAEVQQEPQYAQPEGTSPQPEAQQVQSEVPNEVQPYPNNAPESDGVSGWLCAGIGAFIGLTVGKAVTVLRVI